MKALRSEYRARYVDAQLAALLGEFGAVLVEGPKWCGKTWTCLNQARSSVSLADPAGGFAARTVAQADPQSVLSGESPRLIDEWQVVPAIWDAVRFTVDAEPGVGHFILTGSTQPKQRAVVHSGAGRIARVRMRTLSLAEFENSSKEVSLGGLLLGETPRPILPDTSVTAIAEWIVRGGWPALLERNQARPGVIARQYLAAIEAGDIKDEGEIDPTKLRVILRSLARNTGTLVTKQSLLRDTEQGIKSRETLERYLDFLERIFVLEFIPGWHPSLRSRLRLRSKPKFLLADPSLAAAALGATPSSLLNDADSLGMLFESLCLHDLAVYCDNHEARLFHYRDETGLEADAIIEAVDGSWGAVEIKLGTNRADDAAKHLIRVRDKIVDAGGIPPTFLMLLTGTGPTLLREDGVLQVNIAHLGA